MTDPLDVRRRNMIAGIFAVCVVLVVLGYATFDQLAAFIGGLL